MPSRNVTRHYAANSYYHVYNRGVAKQPIFMEAADKMHLLKIISRHLDPSNTATKSDGTAYRKFNTDMELLCYCLMSNHYHLMFYTGEDASALAKFMQSVFTAYTMYFNKKYKRVGPLFQGVFKASLITNEAYLQHISRYIHLNPRHYRTYFYSSVYYYTGQKVAPLWLKPAKILDMFETDDYLSFLDDHIAHKEILNSIKYELADK